MHHPSSILLPVVALALSAGSVSAVNIAGAGSGIMGVNTSINSALGTPYIQFGSLTSLNDGNTTSAPIDTYNGATTTPVSYAGIVWGSPRTDFITSFTLTGATFFDGGWFGPNNSGPGASSALAASHLITPTIQITLDGGTTWTNVGASSDYVADMTGTPTPVAFGPPSFRASVFTLDTPITGIRGIRVIGQEGGTASGGFIGVVEIGVNAEAIPEPGSLALAGLAGAVLLRRRRRIA